MPLKPLLLKRKILKIKIYKKEEFVCVEFCDNAGGIDKTVIGKVFQPHFTTKPADKGTGLGLYTSKMIVENSLKGKIHIHSADKMTSVHVMLKDLENG